ncbi:MAG: GNAT family N-acetyltransferase [Pseudomonadota bacterium]
MPRSRPVMITDRLILKPTTPDHWPAAWAIHHDPEVMQYIHPVTDFDAHRTRIRRDIYRVRRHGLGYWAIFPKATPLEQVGSVLLIPLEEKFRGVEVGYDFKKSAWGKGYATEAATAVVAYGFEVLRLPTIVGVTHPDNIASQNVLKKAGLVRKEDRVSYGDSGPYLEAHIGSWRPALPIRRSGP